MSAPGTAFGPLTLCPRKVELWVGPIGRQQRVARCWESRSVTRWALRSKDATASIQPLLTSSSPPTGSCVGGDDTHMMLALAESLLACDGVVQAQHLGYTFAAAYREQPWRGYGAGPPRVFAPASRGVSYVDAAGTLFDGAGSLGNGAAMRCAPAAVVGFPDPGLSMPIAADQAVVTHAHPEGRDGAVMLAAVVHLGLATPTTEPLDITRIKPGELQLQSPAMRAVWGELLDAATSTSKLTELAQQLGTSPAASQSVPTAIAVALAVDGDVISTIRAAIVLGGDTDTIAAMAGSVAGAHHGIAELPADLMARLEAGDRIAQLADRLAELPGRR